MAAPYDRYFDYKVFELFRDRLVPIVNRHLAEGSDADIYKHLFVAPEALGRRRSFSLRGVVSPFICFWPLSGFDWNKPFYGRSVLRRDFSYEEDGETKCCGGYLYDVTKQYCLFASSYFSGFVHEVNGALLDVDRLRYFDLECGELLPGFRTRIELMPSQRAISESLDEKGGGRSFRLAATFDMSVTFPVVSADEFIERVVVYLNGQNIYESAVGAVDLTGQANA